MIHSTTVIDCLARIKIIAQNFTVFSSNKTSKIYRVFFLDRIAAGINEIIRFCNKFKLFCYY